jgi:hypothetical protein
VYRAVMVSTSEMFLPLCGKNPWFARVFSMGQGARTIGVRFNVQHLTINIQVVSLTIHTIIWPRRRPGGKMGLIPDIRSLSRL